MMTTWTAEKVKRELPEVQVRLPNGKIVDAVVRGRNNRFATVGTIDLNHSWEFAWKTIAWALNGGTPLRA